MAPLKAREFAAPRAASCPALFTFAQRAFCPAAILARASGLTVRFFALFAAGLALVAFLGAGTAEELLRFRPAGPLRCCDPLTRLGAQLAFLFRATGQLLRPDLRFSAALVPVSNAFTCSSRDISASISATIICVSMNPPVLRITYNLTSTNARRALFIGDTFVL
jgi:hypothetical protein